MLINIRSVKLGLMSQVQIPLLYAQNSCAGLPLHFPGTSLDLLKTAAPPAPPAPVTSSPIELPFGQLKIGFKEFRQIP